MRLRRAIALALLVAVPLCLATPSAPVARAASGAEIRVSTVNFQSWDFPSGTVHSWGHTLVGVPFAIDYTITNAGEQGSQLELGDITVPAGFTLVQAPAASLTAWQSTTMRLRCDALGVGDYSGTVSIGTNDDDENPFTFGISCSVNDAGISGLLALWASVSGAGYELGEGGRVIVGSGDTARVWARDILGSPAPLQLDPVAITPTGPVVGAWSPGNVSASVPVSFTLTCADEAGVPLVGTYSVTVTERLPQSVTFQLECVELHIVSCGSGFAPLGATIAAVSCAVGALLVLTARRRFVTSA